jgi:crotonobetaine/carnitine-CoA ligase
MDLEKYAKVDTYGKLLDHSLEKLKNLGMDPEAKVNFRVADTDVKITYADLYRNTNRICNFLQDLGVKKGDRVGIVLGNCPEYHYLFFALGKLGAIMVPINPFLRGELLEYIIKHSDSKYLITSTEIFNDKISPLINKLTEVEKLMFIDKVVQLEKPEVIAFSEYAKYPTEYEPRQEVSGKDVQGIWYTSGTTGPPKGAVITHSNYMYRVMFFADYFRLKPEHVIYYILPMYHVAYAVWGGPLAVAAGCEIVQVQWFSASRFWNHLCTYKPYIVFSTGTIIPILLKQPETPAELEGKKYLKLWVGWPVDNPDIVKQRWPDIKFIEAYGTTEAPVCSICSIDEPEIGSAGPPLPYTVLKIVDPQTKQELPRGSVGEIVYGHKLGPDYIIKEYYKDPVKTSEAIRNGLWYSGDLGYIDEKGCLHFVDRVKDYIRVAGENVSSLVVESIIRKHPAIQEVAVVGVKGELGHDEIVAHVVPKPGASIEPKEFFEWCNKEMAYFMVPRYLVIRKELPKTATLRVEKYKLREEGVPPEAFDRVKLGIKLRR